MLGLSSRMEQQRPQDVLLLSQLCRFTYSKPTPRGILRSSQLSFMCYAHEKDFMDQQGLWETLSELPYLR